MAVQGAFGTDFYDRSMLRIKHRAYYRSGRPVIKIGPKCALGSHEVRSIHSTPSLGQGIPKNERAILIFNRANLIFQFPQQKNYSFFILTLKNLQ